MTILTQALYNALTGASDLTDLLNTYEGEPAIFTIDPIPGNAVLPYIVTAGEVAIRAFDTKTTEGKEFTRDIRCYDTAQGSAEIVEGIAEEVWEVLHREPLTFDGHTWILTECSGPIQADEEDAYGRIITIRTIVEES